MEARRKVPVSSGAAEAGARLSSPARGTAKGARAKAAPAGSRTDDGAQAPASEVGREASASGVAREAAREASRDAAEVRRFCRARSARSAEILEDYTELIADLLQEHGEARVTDIARRLGVTHPTATKALARLKREGLVTSRPYRGVFLTEAGAKMAERVRARHRLVVDLLMAVGVPRDAAETDAEGMEHYVSDKTLSAFRRFLKTRG